MGEFNAKELREDAERTLKWRQRVYPKRVASRRMTPEQAAYEIAAWEAIVDILRLKEQSEHPTGAA